MPGLSQRERRRERHAVAVGRRHATASGLPVDDRDARVRHRLAGVEPRDEDERGLRAVLDAHAEVGHLKQRGLRGATRSTVLHGLPGSIPAGAIAAHTRPVPPGQSTPRMSMPWPRTASGVTG